MNSSASIGTPVAVATAQVSRMTLWNSHWPNGSASTSPIFRRRTAHTVLTVAFTQTFFQMNL